MRARIVHGIGVLALIASGAAFAAEAEKFAAPQAAERVATPGAGSLVQVTLSLVLVLAAVFVAAWVVRRVKTFGRFAAGPIEIVADTSLGARERAVLVQVGGKQLLLGVAQGSVSVLHVLDEPVSRERLMRDPDLRRDDERLSDGVLRHPDENRGLPTHRPDFKSILKRSLGL